MRDEGEFERFVRVTGQWCFGLAAGLLIFALVVAVAPRLADLLAIIIVGSAALSR